MSLNSLGGIMSSEGALDTSSAKQGVRLVSMSPGVLKTQCRPTHLGVVCLISELRHAHQQRFRDNLYAMSISVSPTRAFVEES